MTNKILIINQHANNLGDEAAGLALIERLISEKYLVVINYLGEGELHYKDDRLFSDVPRIKEIGVKKILLKIISNYLGIKYEGGAKLKKYSKEIFEAQVVVISPSGADLGHYTGWGALLNFILVKSFNKKIIFCLNSIDMSPNYIFEKIKKLFLRECSIYVREKRCLEYMSKIGRDARFGIDTAFLLKTPLKINKAPRIIFVYSQFDFLHSNSEKRKIDGIVRNVIINDIVKFARKEGKTIEIIPHLLTDDESKYLSEIFIEMKKRFSMVIYNNKIENAFDYQKSIAEAEIVISMRYHPLVLAAKNFVPFIGLSYDPKMKEVASYAGLSKYTHEFDEVKNNVIYNDLVDIYMNYKEKVCCLQSNIKPLIYTAEQPLNEIKRMCANDG